MKKILALVAILALWVPAVAFAAAEFTLGGFVKLDAFWSSTQDGKNVNTPILRNNDPNFQHGRIKSTAQGSRFNLTIKGPDLCGAKTSGFIETDFDAAENGAVSTAAGTFIANSASNSYTPRLRHAMFRFSWPTTELLFGQYWSMFSEFYNESVQDGPLQGHGSPTARLAQVRVTQKFGNGFSIAGLIGQPTNSAGLNGVNYILPNNGESAETPQVQAKLMYEENLWGKAAYFGAPMPFTARLIGGWQQNVYRYRQGTIAANTFGKNGFNTVAASFGNHQYLDPWMGMANVFIPVIPTHSANLAGTASLSAQASIGQGLGAFGNNMGADVYGSYQGTFRVGGTNFQVNNYDEALFRQFGGYIQGQYYFTNHWFTNVTWGVQRQYGVSQSRFSQLVTAANPQGYATALPDQPNSWQEIDVTLWYRPVQAFKFGLQYAWQQTSWMQIISTGAADANTSKTGNSSRVEFVGFFYF